MRRAYSLRPTTSVVLESLGQIKEDEIWRMCPWLTDFSFPFKVSARMQIGFLLKATTFLKQHLLWDKFWMLKQHLLWDGGST